MSSDLSQDFFSQNEPLKRSMTLPERPSTSPRRSTSSAGTLNRLRVQPAVSEEAEQLLPS